MRQRKRRTYQNRGGPRRVAMSKSTGRLRKNLSITHKGMRGMSARLGWQGKMKAYKNLKRKRYYKRNIY